MARIIVISDTEGQPDRAARVLMDEHVTPEHLGDERASNQIIQRVGWAVVDAQEASPAPDR